MRTFAMTLIVAAMCRETIWLMADRRLSTPAGKRLSDSARKIMLLETIDGIALLGYAGLGKTALGMEPSDWMSNVLRGRNMPLESSLAVLANAAKAQLPRHLRLTGHTIIVPAFVHNSPRLYALGFDPQQKSCRSTRIVSSLGGRENCLDWAIGGTGATYLLKEKPWRRELLRMMRAHERNSLSAHAVADHLAKLNFHVYSVMSKNKPKPDESVGPRCIVVWRHRKGGGAHNCYSGTSRDDASIVLPSIANGGDIGAIMSVFAPPAMKAMQDWMEQGGPFQPPDEAALNAALANLPREPDESLR
jgi:hypothetical protein